MLGCIDSRVPPELVFDQGLGDLITVRSAGEVLDEAVLGSIAYGVLELGIPLVVVLGHQSCGAVRAAVEADRSGGRLPDHIQYLADEIRPAIDHSKEGDARIAATVEPTYGACAPGWPPSPTSPPGSRPGNWQSWVPATT